MPRVVSVFAAWILLFGVLAAGSADAQDEGTEEEAPVELGAYGDVELIETLQTYGLLDEWVAASSVSPEASLLLVTGSGAYQTQRQNFLDGLDEWARRTAAVRTRLAEIDAAQTNTDRLRSITNQVWESLVLDDRLAAESNTLVAIEDALGQLALVDVPEQLPDEIEDPLILAQIQLLELVELAETELLALNGVAPAFTASGVEAFLGYEDLRFGLNSVDQLIARARDSIRPAREDSERLVSAALRQIPNLHAARMLGSSDVGGLSVVTVDAYIKAAAGSTCSVDWALLAGIGGIESNHGRLGGASVSASGQVSTTILGPLLDGGETARELDVVGQLDDEQRVAVAEIVETVRLTARTALQTSALALFRSLGVAADQLDLDRDEGNGFAVVIDSDGGRLDGNDRWDRAVGPMQFLPETWSRWATDGNSDGVADPNNLYDAAAAAGRFLCDLSATIGPSPSSFVLGYNSSTTYVRRVLAAAQEFRAASLPPG